MIRIWTWTVNSHNYSIHTQYLPLRPKFWSGLLYDQLFLRYNKYKVGENRKRIEWPQTDLEDSTVKSTLYVPNTYPGGPNFGPFRSKISRFRNPTCTRSEKIGNRMTPNWTWTLNSQKYPLYTAYTPEAKILVCFALRLPVPEIQCRQKSEMDRMTEYWNWKNNCQNYSIYAK